MLRLLPVLILSMALCAVATPTAATAQAPDPVPIAAEDTHAARELVRAQLAAFASDDADKAFSLASPSIRQAFGTAEQFMRMVRGAYPVVYRPASVIFLKPELEQDDLLQPVHMTDQSGSGWLAVYQLQRQEDKSWRISGCVLLPRAGKTI